MSHRTGRRMIPGYHAVRETLLDDFLGVEALWIVSGKRSGRMEEICALAGRRGIPVVEVQASDLEKNAPGVAHQGVALVITDFSYTPIEDISKKISDGTGERLIVALDHITDEGNFGAVIRTAAFFNVEALVIPKDRSARMTPSVLKRASGAHSAVAVSRVVNLSRALEQLKQAGIWIVGASGEASTSYYDFDWRLPTALVLGNERRGLGTVVRKACDHLVAIPSLSRVESLNVAVAAGVLLGEIYRQRLRG